MLYVGSQKTHQLQCSHELALLSPILAVALVELRLGDGIEQARERHHPFGDGPQIVVVELVGQLDVLPVGAP